MIANLKNLEENCTLIDHTSSKTIYLELDTINMNTMVIIIEVVYLFYI